MRPLYAALALGILLAAAGLALLAAEPPEGRPAAAGPIRSPDSPAAPADAEASAAPLGAPGGPVRPPNLSPDARDLPPDTQGASGADSASLWSDVQVMAKTWWVNCRSGPIGRFGRSLERLRAVAEDPATTPAKREQAEQAIRQLEHMEDDWDVQLCGWISEE